MSLFYFIPTLVLILSVNVYAKETCYSVELSSYITKSTLATKSKLPKACKLLNIGIYSSIRCGCFTDIKKAKSLLKSYKKDYKHAYIVTTLKRRFSKPKPKQKQKNKNKNEILITNKYTFDVSKITLTPNLKSTNISDHKEIEEHIQEYIKNSEKQIVLGNNKSKFYGLSIQGKYDQYLNQNYLNREYTDYEYNMKIKYDIFKNGYYEHKLENIHELAINKQFFYYNLINLQKYNYEENLAKLTNLIITINKNYYTALVDICKAAIQREETRVKNGTSAKYKIKHLLNEKNRYKRLRASYQTADNLTVNRDIYNLLLHIDTLKLIELDKLIKDAKAKSIAIELEHVNYKLFNNSKSFYDDIMLNVYISKRGMDEVGWYDTYGAEVSIPLNFTTQENKRINILKRDATKIKEKALKKYIETTLRNLVAQFNQLQSITTSEKETIHSFYLELKDFKAIAKHTIPTLEVNFEEKIFTLQKDVVTAKYTILLNRVEILKILLNISYISNIVDLTKIIKGSD